MNLDNHMNVNIFNQNNKPFMNKLIMKYMMNKKKSHKNKPFYNLLKF